jgi:hypothetical protein
MTSPERRTIDRCPGHNGALPLQHPQDKRGACPVAGGARSKEEVSMTTAAARSLSVLLVSAVALLPMTGCPPCNCGDPEGVLEGTWHLTGEALDPSITEFFIEFSSRGEINAVSYKINNLTFDYRDLAIVGFADVDGSEVDISADWAVGEFIFNGTINETGDVMEGSITYEFFSGGVSIGSDLGAATLTKQ